MADEDPALVAHVCGLLEARGYATQRASNGLELLDQLVNHGPFSLLVADVVMPWMNCIRAYQTAQQLGARLPAVVVLTAESLGDVHDWVRSLGPAGALVRKPLAPQALLEAVARVAGAGGARRP